MKLLLAFVFVTAPLFAKTVTLSCSTHYRIIGSEEGCGAIALGTGPSLGKATFETHVVSLEGGDENFTIHVTSQRKSLNDSPDTALIHIFHKGEQSAATSSNVSLLDPVGGRLRLRLEEVRVQDQSRPGCKYYRDLSVRCFLE